MSPAGFLSDLLYRTVIANLEEEGEVTPIFFAIPLKNVLLRILRGRAFVFLAATR